MNVTVTPLSGDAFTVTIDVSGTVQDLHQAIADAEGIHLGAQRLFHKGAHLDDSSKSLREVQIVESTTVDLVKPAPDVLSDFNHSNDFLRAARNRVHNALETSKTIKKQADECLELIDKLYNEQVAVSYKLLEGFEQAVKARAEKSISEYLRALNRYNRQTVKLSRVMESDMSDYQPEPPEYEYEEDKPPTRPADPDRTITVTKFLKGLQVCWQSIQDSKSKSIASAK